MCRKSYLACEVVCCEIKEIMEAIMNNKALMDKMWNILDKKPPLVPLHANSFAKIMSLFIMRDTLKVFEYIKSRSSVVESLLKHLENSGIVDVVLRLMICDDNHDGDDDLVQQWLHGQDIIKHIIGKYEPILTEESHVTASFILMDMITAFHHAQNPRSDLLNHSVLIRQLKSTESITRLVDFMSVDPPKANSSSCIVNGVNILIELLRRGTCAEEYNVTHAAPEGGEFGNLPPPPPPVQRDALEISELVAVLVKRISCFKDILVKPRQPIVDMETSHGKLRPLGSERLAVMELFAELLRVQSKEVFQQFLEHDIVQLCIDNFFEYRWNNLMHMVVFDLLHSILTAPFEVTKSLALSVFVKSKLTQRITEAVRLNSYHEDLPKGSRLGYMGHITLITDNIILFLERKLDKEFEEAIFPFLQADDWQEFIAKIHKETKEKETKPLGGQKFTKDFIKDDDVPFSMHVDTETDQLARFMIHQVVKDLPDKFMILDFSTKQDNDVWNTLINQESSFDAQPLQNADSNSDEVETDEDDDSADDDEQRTVTASANEFPSIFQQPSDDPFSNLGNDTFSAPGDSSMMADQPSDLFSTNENWADFSVFDQLSIKDAPAATQAPPHKQPGSSLTDLFAEGPLHESRPETTGTGTANEIRNPAEDE